MSQPFIARVQQLMAQRTDTEIVKNALDVIHKYSIRSTSASVPLDDMAWLAAFIAKASEGARNEIMRRSTHLNPDGSRVINITADDSVKAADGAG